MDNTEFKSIIDIQLKPHGFKKKGNYWRLKLVEIEKVVNLQKSNFSNLYYINYGYNLNGLDDEDAIMHVFNRLKQIDAFDLENKLSNKERRSKIEYLIKNTLLPEMESVNSENDLISQLRKRSHVNDITLKVKEYLKLF